MLVIDSPARAGLHRCAASPVNRAEDRAAAYASANRWSPAVQSTRPRSGWVGGRAAWDGFTESRSRFFRRGARFALTGRDGLSELNVPHLLWARRHGGPVALPARTPRADLMALTPSQRPTRE